MLIIKDNQICGNSAWTAPRENPYFMMKPWLHECGAAHWIIAIDGSAFTDDNGVIYQLRRRTQAEIELTPEYIACTKKQPLPTIYAHVAFSGGDGKVPIIGLKLGHPTKGVMDISGDLRLTPETPGLPVMISYEWRITIRKILSEFATQAIESFPVDGCAVVNNAIQWNDFDPDALGMSPGIYLISDEDFATIPGALFGLPQDYQVKIVGGAKLFKVLK